MASFPQTDMVAFESWSEHFSSGHGTNGRPVLPRHRMTCHYAFQMQAAGCPDAPSGILPWDQSIQAKFSLQVPGKPAVPR